MDDCVWMEKPSQYVTGHLGQLSLPSLRVGKLSTSLSGWGKSESTYATSY